MRRDAILFAVFVLGLVAGTRHLTATEPALPGKEKRINLNVVRNLVGWWKLDEVTGDIAADFSRHGRNGTLRGGLSFDRDSASGRMGKALKFDGKDDCVEISGYKGVTGTRPRTMAAWIKTKSPEGEIISWGQDDYGKMWIFGFIRSRVGVTPKGGYLYMNAEVDDGAWHHVAVVVREADLPNLHDHVKLYLDGVPAEIHDIGLLDLWPIETGSDRDVTIGRGFQGLIDDVRIYDCALSEEEIRLLFAPESGSTSPESR